jgi:hypothetical protein
MHGSASPPSPAVLLSAACGICGHDMRLAYVDPTGTNTVYAYRCDDGHRREILRADKRPASVVGQAIAKPGVGPASPRSALVSDLPSSSGTQRDWPHNLSGGCVMAEPHAGRMRPIHSASCSQYARVGGIQ